MIIRTVSPSSRSDPLLGRACAIAQGQGVFRGAGKVSRGRGHLHQRAVRQILTAKFNWLKPPTPEDRKTYSAYGYGKVALEAMWRVCGSEAGKEAVKQKIKSLTCSFGPQRTVVLKDGTIDYEVNFNSSNDVDYVFEYLQPERFTAIYRA